MATIYNPRTQSNKLRDPNLSETRVNYIKACHQYRFYFRQKRVIENVDPDGHKLRLVKKYIDRLYGDGMSSKAMDAYNSHLLGESPLTLTPDIIRYFGDQPETINLVAMRRLMKNYYNPTV